METEINTSKWLAPEDVNAGDFVTVTHMTYEMISMGCDQPWKPTIEAKKVTLLHFDAGRPLKVVSVCLPFLLVKDAAGKHTPIDLRRCRIARLSPEYGKRMFKSVKAV